MAIRSKRDIQLSSRSNGRKTTILNGKSYREGKNLRGDLGSGKSRKVNKTVSFSVQSREESPHQVAPFIWRTDYESIGRGRKPRVQRRNPKIKRSRPLSQIWRESQEEVMVPELRNWATWQELEHMDTGTTEEGHPEKARTKEKL